MALPPRTFDFTQHDSLDERMLHWHRAALRMFTGYEELREHCRRQRAMIAAQRELIRRLDEQDAFADGGDRAGSCARGVPEEDVSAAE